MKIVELSLAGLKMIVPKVHYDTRGFFLESYHEGRYQQGGVECKFVQDNHSRSEQGVVRGMHFQTAPGQAKLVRVTVGKIFDVAVDIRPESKTFGRWEGVELSAENHHQLFVPIGFAHGFCVMSPVAEVLYKVSHPYDPATETGFRYDDPAVGIRWPLPHLSPSQRDLQAQSFTSLCTQLGRPLP